jgi:hypothetical protein
MDDCISHRTSAVSESRREAQAVPEATQGNITDYARWHMQRGCERQHAKPVRLRGNDREGEEGKGELGNLAHC